MELYTQTYVCLALLFGGIGWYALRRKSPMWLWPGTQVSAEKITHIEGYNRAVSRAWFLYSIPYWLAVVLQNYNPTYAATTVTIAATMGVLILGIAFFCIYRRFSSQKK